MDSTKAAAHRAGALYFLFALLSIYSEFLVPRFMVPGNAAATAHNIVASETAYRFGVLTSFANLVVFLFVVWTLQSLFRDVDRRQATLMVLLVAVGVAVGIANLLVKVAVLVLLSGADFLAVMPRPQLEALALGLLRMHSGGAGLVTAFWGLWLFPFGVLVIKSRFLPRILGFLLLVAGVGYLVTSCVSIALPAYRPVVSRVMMPLYMGEVPVILWLLIMGARVPRPKP